MFEFLNNLAAEYLVAIVDYALRFVRYKGNIWEVNRSLRVEGLRTELTEYEKKLVSQIVEEIEKAENTMIEQLGEDSVEKYTRILIDTVRTRMDRDRNYDWGRGHQLLEELRSTSVKATNTLRGNFIPSRRRAIYKWLNSLFTLITGVAGVPAIMSQQFSWIMLWAIGLIMAILSNYFLIILDERGRQDMLKEQASHLASLLNHLQKREMDIRHVLVGIRNLFVSRLDALDDLLKLELDQLHEQQFIDLAYSALGFDDVMQRIMTAILSVYSGGNQNLDQRFSVSFMTVCHDELKIQYWENVDGVVPEVKSKDEGFKIGEGCAGSAWLHKKEIYEPDTGDPRYFVARTERHEHSTKSILSVPVTHRSRDEGDIFLGVLNIDTSIRGFFQDTPQHRKEASIRLRPYIYMIGLVYRGKQLIDKIASVTEAEGAK